MKKLVLLGICILLLVMCLDKSTYYSYKINTLKTPAEIASLATDIAKDDSLSAKEKVELMAKLSKRTATLIKTKFQESDVGKSAKELLNELQEYVQELKEEIVKE